jgi:hypothetical protein
LASPEIIGGSMKKFLVVLTILVLVAGFAFAAVTGTIEARYKFDFTDAKSLEYDILGSHKRFHSLFQQSRLRLMEQTSPMLQ